MWHHAGWRFPVSGVSRFAATGQMIVVVVVVVVVVVLVVTRLRVPPAVR